ncbi:hypothetical protein TREMEDRAFT_60465 [Tremella mesenterica DSM 1558]|uniref:uncharacterized protein n=1 Tax=Tremella mesenterica (strain ATCC 24925 / CBS 8224 / DSM 1558 / NBRC 9311 / NRRL Y-6157 / RJB 2259-6 / UBC 559-6) TaxID=578456 RepID=UPI0003F4A1C5|nr:uncharacterized protein TREMEDRAFT_60465 [Tremella mesenterica DSM 1558]EIW71541.1 hypothetical protein TREMEDRAFT_60465 [Tremella mesenterica DSM 1558]
MSNNDLTTGRSSDEKTFLKNDTEYPPSVTDTNTDKSGYQAWVDDDDGDNEDLHDNVKEKQSTLPGGQVNVDTDTKTFADPTKTSPKEEKVDNDDDDDWEDEAHPERNSAPNSGFSFRFSIPLDPDADHSTCDPAICGFASNARNTDEEIDPMARVVRELDSLTKTVDDVVCALETTASLLGRTSPFGRGTHVDSIRQQAYRQGLKDGSSKHSSSSSFYAGAAHAAVAATVAYGVKSYLSG